jgi:hypothetical protein
MASACGFTPTVASDGRVGDGVMIDVETFHDAPIDGPGGARRKPITIDHSKVAGPLADFPVWIDISGADIAGGAQPDGKDIFLTDANGTALDYEIERWSSPRLLAWVRIANLSDTTDTKIYVRYGDVSQATAHPANPAGVFGANDAAVWHLDDTLATTAIADSTGTHAGTATGLTTGAHVTGKLGSAITFDGSGTGSIAFTNPFTNGPHTISVWVNQNTVNHTSAIVTIGDNNTDRARFLYGHYGGSSNTGIGTFNDDWVPTNNIEGAGWVLLHWVHEGGNKKTHLYRNGVEIAGSPHTLTGAPNTMTTTGLIGFAPEPEFGAPNGMSGIIDELRLATTVRSGDWIETEYANQNSPMTFYQVGPDEPAL